MKRRDFLQASAVAACLAFLRRQAADCSVRIATPEYYEWRTYRVEGRAAQQTALLDHLEQAALSRLAEAGNRPRRCFHRNADKHRFSRARVDPVQDAR